MPAKKTKEEFIKEAVVVHGSKYDYSKVIYNGTHTKVTIICPEHGEFQRTPKQHFREHRGCHICGLTNVAAFNKSRELSQDEFIARATSIHEGRYDYSKTVYNGGSKKVIIGCSIHGYFHQKAENHINLAHGCLKCCYAARKGKGTGGYGLNYFDYNPEMINAPAWLYVARITYGNDDFIKIGVTIRDGVKGRFYHSKRRDEKIIPLLERPLPLRDAFNTEQLLLAHLSEYRYFPNRKFSGYTECFKHNSQTLSMINDYFGINTLST